MDSVNGDQDRPFPWEIRDLQPELAEERKKYFKGETFVQVGPKGYVMHDEYRKYAAGIYNLQLEPTDAFILGYPRSGTTMTQELVWLLQNDLDYEKALSISMVQRVPYLEMSVTINPEGKKRIMERNHSEEFLKILEWTVQPAPQLMRGMSSPRTVKTHIPLSLLPPNLLEYAKVVYIARDPRDVAISHYHLMKDSMMVEYSGDFKNYWNFFVNSANVFTPYFDHVKEAWEKRHHPNLLFLFYEEIIKDPPSTIRRVANFLNKNLTENQLNKLCEHLSFDNFKKNKSVNDDFTNKLYGLIRDDVESTFIRKGKSGGWRDYLDEEMARDAQRWIEDNIKNSDLCFPVFSKNK